MSELLPLDTLLEGDCLEILQKLPEHSVDLVFADPPYNLQLRQELWRPNLSRVDAVNDEWDQFDNFEAYDQFTHHWLSGCRRVLKENGTLWVIGTYHNIFRVGNILQNLGFWILNDFTWIKNNPMPNFRGVRFTNAHETLIWAQKHAGKSYTFNHHAMKSLNEDLQMRSDWYIPICSGKERLRVNGSKIHTTQKPEALLYRVLMASSNPGDIILDPFFGTGTTGAVAKKLGRHWIGIEKDSHYVNAARNRIDLIQASSGDQDIFSMRNPRREPRLPFGALLENSLLQPGQFLHFGAGSDIKALVLADGSLQYEEMRGSIHQIARAICKGPCNGWIEWYYLDKITQKWLPIDHLRQSLRVHFEKPEEEIP